MDGVWGEWVGVKAVLRIAYSNQNFKLLLAEFLAVHAIIFFLLINRLRARLPR